LRSMAANRLVCMVKGMGAISEYATTVVRLFPDYAESVIWFDSPVSYEESRLDARLITDLQMWEASYYAGLTSGYSWRTAGLETRFRTEGARLARPAALHFSPTAADSLSNRSACNARCRGHWWDALGALARAV